MPIQNFIFRCSAHPAEPSELRFSELGFIAPGIMDVDGWLIGGRLVGWLLVVARWLVIIGYLLSIGWLVGDCWLSLLCPLLGGLLVGCCWSSVVDWWAVVGQPP